MLARSMGMFWLIRSKLVTDAKSKGVYQSLVMDEVFDKMEAGEAAVATYYAGDYLSMLENNRGPGLRGARGGLQLVRGRHVHPEEPLSTWRRPRSGSTSSPPPNPIWPTWTTSGYASPNLEALEGYPAYYEETYGEPLDEERYEIMAAPDDVLARCELYTNLPADTLTLYNDLWTELGI